MEIEIELLKLRVLTNEGEIKSVDEKIIQEINKMSRGSDLESISKLWIEDCNKEELRSVQRWETRTTWFSSNETVFQTEYTFCNLFPM